jgi:hypothetical protein
MEDVKGFSARDAAKREAAKEGARLERKRRLRLLVRVVAEVAVLMPKNK